MESRKDHADLIQRLTRQMSPDMIVEMKDYLLSRRSIERKDYEELDRLHLIIDHLERLAVINISEKEGYKLLIDTFEAINQHALAKQVQRHQEKFCRDGDDSSSREAEPTTSEQSARGELPKSGDAAGKDQFQDLLSQLASKNETIACLKKEKEELSDEVEEYKRELITKEKDNKQLQEELDTTKKEKTELQEELETTKKEKTELQEELDITKKEKTELQEELETTKKEKTELQEVLRTTIMEKTELQKYLHTTKKEKTELQEELDTTKKEKIDLQAYLDTLTMEKTELQEELDTTKKKLQEQGQEGGVQGAVGGTADIQRYQGQEGVQLAKGPRDIKRCREVFQKEYGTNIRSIVNLGDRFAVAHGPSWDEIGVDIYNISGVKQQTLEDNIEGLCDLAVTPDKGTLVAVCDEGDLGPYTIREFDPVRGGHIRSTPQFRVDGTVRGFDVCDGQQFVILHLSDTVSFVNDEGSVVLTEKVKSPSYSISCGGRHVFLTRGGPSRYVDVYEITEDRHLKHIATSQHSDLVLDVSATAAGEVTVTCERGVRWYLGRSTFKDNKFSEWKYKHVDSRWQVLVSVGGDHVVVAGEDNNNRTRILRVFEEEV